MYQLLILDDEISVVKGLAMTLPWEDLDIEIVHQAFSGEDALEIMKKHSIDIVITDIKMPGMNGLDFIHHAKKISRKAKFILLSGFADFNYAQQAIQNQADAYLLKPISDEKLFEEVEKVLIKLKKEWEEIVSYQRSIATLKENLPLLRGNLLNDLLRGRYSLEKDLYKKMEMFDIPFDSNQPVSMVTVRMEQDISEYHIRNPALLEYSICNIAEEIYTEYFHIWFCKDPHDYLIFLIALKPDTNQKFTNCELRQKLVENTTSQFQKSVKKYLKGKISVLLSSWGEFPQNVTQLYESSITALRKKIGNDNELFLSLLDQKDHTQIHSLQSLYMPPTLIQLLEVGRWESIEEKLQIIFSEIETKWSDSQEHILEVFFMIASAFTHIAHKNGKLLNDLIGTDFYRTTQYSPFKSIQYLKDWTYRILTIIKDDMTKEVYNNRKFIVNKIHQFVEEHLSEDVSLQTIAKHVFLHPVYISKIYKLETGENLSDYLVRIRMEKASNLLVNNMNEKVYEISKKVGYQNVPYFIKVFKKYYGNTPQEFREARNVNRFI